MIDEIEEAKEKITTELDNFSEILSSLVTEIIDKVYDIDILADKAEEDSNEVLNTLQEKVTFIIEMVNTNFEGIAEVVENNETGCQQEQEIRQQEVIDLLQQADKILSKVQRYTSNQELKILRARIDEFHRDNDIERPHY